MGFPQYVRLISRYALLSWLVLLAQMATFFREVPAGGRYTVPFVGAVWLTYSLVYLLPILLLAIGLARCATLGSAERGLARLRLTSRAVVYPGAVLLFSFLQVIIFADHTIFHLYGFHLNGFVWNLLITPGGIESLGGGTATNVSFALIITGFVLLQAGLLFAAARGRWVISWLDRLLTRRKFAVAVVLIVLIGAAQLLAYGFSSLRGYSPVLVAADAFPFYVPVTFRSLARRWGWQIESDDSPTFKANIAGIRYPLKPIERKPVDKPLNIVWLVSESLRRSQLDPVIMPKTWEFSRQANTFEQHYSGGNGTRMAMFSMFYGLYGTYWFNFLKERRGPVLMDVLIDANYQMKMFTSAKFTYPEFDKTIFSRVPPELLHEGDAQPKWRRDRENVDMLLDFVEKRDASRPFMTFMFFESPHANYYFSQDNIVSKPYAADLNYATMDLAKDIALIKARYDNACNHLDSQLDRIITYLREHQLLDSTIVLITGDHGEEFMEKGHWGHARGYPDEQTVVPMVLWVPGRPPQLIKRMTSHLDLPATVLPLLGVANPPEDYSLGYDMLGDTSRTFTVLCDWNNLCIVDDRYKATFPTSGYSWRGRNLTTKDDRPVENPAAFYEADKPRMVEIMKQMKLFSR